MPSAILIKSSLGSINFQPDIVNKYNFLLMNWQISNFSSFILLIAVGLTGVTGFFSLFGALLIQILKKYRISSLKK